MHILTLCLALVSTAEVQPGPVRTGNTGSAVAIELIDLAVARGVPLFNAGQPLACASIYEVAAASLLRLDCGLTEGERLEIRAGLMSTAHQPHDERAWSLRHTLELTRAALVRGTTTDSASPASRTAPARVTQEEVQMIFDFSKTTPEWRQLHDNVMGGISSGTYRRTDRETGVFSGALSLANNGGFATIRSPARDMKLVGYEGLEFRIKGDGRRYTLGCLPSDRRSEFNVWRREFATVKGEWILVRVPLDSLQHSVMGRRLSSPPIPPDRIRSLSFMVSDKDETPFCLEIDWIRAYRAASGFSTNMF